jgi:hypothetical protein
MTETVPPPTCDAPTQSGRPCTLVPMPGRGGRCHVHAGIGPTASQQAASRQNRVTHGLHMKDFRDETERAVHDEVLHGDVETHTMQRQALAAARLRLARILDLETTEGPSRYAQAAFNQFRVLLKETPASSEKPFNPLEEAALIQQMNDLLRVHPELFIEGYPPPVQAAILKVIREGGEAPAGPA